MVSLKTEVSLKMEGGLTLQGPQYYTVTPWNSVKEQKRAIFFGRSNHNDGCKTIRLILGINAKEGPTLKRTFRCCSPTQIPREAFAFTVGAMVTDVSSSAGSLCGVPDPLREPCSTGCM